MKRIVNKNALREYQIQEKLEAGIVLHGDEVKSIKNGSVQLKGAFVTIRDNELWLTNAHISPYQAGQPTTSAPDRDRKLLVKKNELASLIGNLKARGLTVVPLSFYTKGGIIKVEIGIGRGKRKTDKRASLKERDLKLQMKRRLRQKI